MFGLAFYPMFPTPDRASQNVQAAPLRKHAHGWEVRAMRREWEKWCKSEGITPDNALAHFISFLKRHVKLNGKCN